MAKEKELANFIFELGQLKKIKRSGWRLVGIDNPESVADHNLRVAQIGYILAKMENYPKPEEVCTILVFHELAECRICDIDKVANRYVEYDEKEITLEQTKNLGEVGKEIEGLVRQILLKDTLAGVIAKDADRLETAFTAKEYLEKGCQTEDWINNCLSSLKTKSAKKLGKSMLKQSSIGWWKGIKKF
jgi:putative hydrolases of HD superfamily